MICRECHEDFDVQAEPGAADDCGYPVCPACLGVQRMRDTNAALQDWVDTDEILDGVSALDGLLAEKKGT